MVQFRRKSKRKGLFNHFTSLGFTNRLAIYILLFLAAGLIGGFYLAMKSIAYGYTGALMCWTVVFTPIGTAVGIAISKVVDKSKAENTGGNGDGIKYAIAMSDLEKKKITGKAQKFDLGGNAYGLDGNFEVHCGNRFRSGGYHPPCHSAC